MLDAATRAFYELLAAREVEADVDGRSRKITVYSTRRYLRAAARNLCE
jgi:hypothetical protein